MFLTILVQIQIYFFHFKSITFSLDHIHRLSDNEGFPVCPIPMDHSLKILYIERDFSMVMWSLESGIFTAIVHFCRTSLACLFSEEYYTFATFLKGYKIVLSDNTENVINGK
jgi:hypothetical protein